MQYIQTFEKLEEVSLGLLGEMTVGSTYQGFMEKARLIAEEAKVERPILMLAMEYKPDNNVATVGIYTEDSIVPVSYERPSTKVVYPIADFEWDDFVNGISEYLTTDPSVHVVDGSKYTAPI